MPRRPSPRHGKRRYGHCGASDRTGLAGGRGGHPRLLRLRCGRHDRPRRLARLELAVGGSGVARAPIQLRPEAAPGIGPIPGAPGRGGARGFDSSGAPARPGEDLRLRRRLDSHDLPVRRDLGRLCGEAAGCGAIRRSPAPARRRSTGARRIGPALDEPHEPLFEDYFVFEVDRFTEPFERRIAGPACAAALARSSLFEDRELVRRGTRRPLALARLLLSTTTSRSCTGTRPLSTTGRGRASRPRTSWSLRTHNSSNSAPTTLGSTKSSTRSTPSAGARSAPLSADAKLPARRTACATCSSTSSN